MKNILEFDFARMGLIFFSIATVAFGIQNFIYGDFVMGRAPSWPEHLSGGIVWAIVSGVLLIFSGITMMVKWKGWVASISVAIILLVWALGRHILMGHFHWGTEITQTGKAWTLFGGALAMATLMPDAYSDFQGRMLLIGRFCLAAFMILCGIEHFMFVEFVAQLVPNWIPVKSFWTYFSGVALIAGGIGLLIPVTVRIAAILSGTMIFIWFVILHIPRAMYGQGDGNEWVAVFEALAVSGIALVVSKSNGKRLSII
jgi:uncharacterized membrane protein